VLALSLLIVLPLAWRQWWATPVELHGSVHHPAARENDIRGGRRPCHRQMAVSPTADTLRSWRHRGRSAGTVVALGDLKPSPLPGTDGASYPFWSANSQSLGFFTNSKLKRVDLAGGTPLPSRMSRSMPGEAH
jgi:hypothetical protein